MKPEAIKKNFKFYSAAHNNGFTLIHALIATFIVIVASFGIYSAFNFSLKILQENKARATAISIAEEKMELVRNLPYDNIGTVGGIPSGSILQNEILPRNGISFLVATQIFYIDDAFDGVLGGNPDDLLNTDYKRARITVSWPGTTYGKPVTLITYITPKGLESAIGGGTLRISVFDANGLPVPQAGVYIKNIQVLPNVLINSTTSDNGQLIVPGAKPSQESYEITAVKDGYSTDKTYPISAEFPYPVKPHASIIENEVTELSFAIDLVGTINISTISENYPLNFKINTASSTKDQVNPKITRDNNNFYYFVWQDYKDGDKPKIYAQKYNSSRLNQWSLDNQLSTAVNQVNPATASDGVNIYIAWNDDRNGNQDSYLVKLSADGAKLWSGDKKISVSQSSADQIKPDLTYSTSTTRVIVVFQDNRSGNWDIYAQKYDSDGTLAWPSEVKINTDVSSWDQLNPQIILDADNNFYVVWQDFRDGINWNIYAQKYDLAGNKIWVSDAKINIGGGASDSINPALAIDSQEFLYVVWQDNRGGDWDAYIQKIDLNGQPQWLEDKIISVATFQDQTSPSITRGESNNLYVSWTDARNGHTDIYAQKLSLDAQKLWPSDERINMDPANAEQDSSDLLIDANNKIIFVWEDNREKEGAENNYNIYAAEYSGPGTQVNVPNVPLNVRGTKLIYSAPAVYKFDNNFITDGNGSLTLSNVEWDSYTISSQATSTYTLISSDPLQPINLNPGQSVNVSLNMD